MSRPQFSLKSMLWLMALVGAFLAGTTWRRRADQAALTAAKASNNEARVETERLRAEFIRLYDQTHGNRQTTAASAPAP
jgi:hypothetical protein